MSFVFIVVCVVDMNIDEVLRLSDLSLVPQSFIDEIQRDQVYETILEELQKKSPHHLLSKPAAIPEEDEQQPFSPHLLAIDDDDDDNLSIADETSSSTSSESNEAPAHEDYDTDIEPG